MIGRVFAAENNNLQADADRQKSYRPTPQPASGGGRGTDDVALFTAVRRTLPRLEAAAAAQGAAIAAANATAVEALARARRAEERCGEQKVSVK